MSVLVGGHGRLQTMQYLCILCRGISCYPAILQERDMYTMYYTKPMVSIKHERVIQALVGTLDL